MSSSRSRTPSSSLNRSANRKPLVLALQYAAHFRQLVPGLLPLTTNLLKR
jgi:hypothetical protein